MTDDLTKLLNRGAYEAELEKNRNTEVSKDFVIIALDVNQLKYVNDTFGHAAGDELICGLADCLRESYGTAGKVFRIGGDEFTVMLNADEKTLSEMHEKFNELVKNWKGKEVSEMHVSSGQALSAESDSIDDLARLADSRMYEDKNLYYRNNGLKRRRF